MKIFISHQKDDAAVARRIADRLTYQHHIESYLDVIDSQLNKPGYDLSRYLREQISKCSHLLAVTSQSTRLSQWVPWEIGVATEKDYPLATFADYPGAVPEFLQAWPYLKTLSDVDVYANAAKTSEAVKVVKKTMVTEARAQRESADEFFTKLRRDLGQPIYSARR